LGEKGKESLNLFWWMVCSVDSYFMA